DGIRDRNVTGVQTCALPISVGRGFVGGAAARRAERHHGHHGRGHALGHGGHDRRGGCAAGRYVGGGGVRLLPGGTEQHPGRRREIGRASCRERGEAAGGGGG